jgi:hypothetical protein
VEEAKGLNDLLRVSYERKRVISRHPVVEDDVARLLSTELMLSAYCFLRLDFTFKYYGKLCGRGEGSKWAFTDDLACGNRLS